MVFCLLTGVGGIAELLSALLIFAFVLLVTYLTTRFVGTYEKHKMTGRNLIVVESVRLSGGKSIDLVKVGDKYIVLGESRDSVSFLCELDEGSVAVPPEMESGAVIQKPDFRKFLEKAGDKFHRNDGK